jgi:hypothetical protein
MNTKFFFSALLCTLLAAQVAGAATRKPGKRVSPRFSRVCSQVQELGNNQYKTNSPIRAQFGNNASPIVRFALNPTIIFVVGNPAKLSRALVYDKAGNLLTSGNRLGCDAPGRGTCNSRYKGFETGGQDTRSIRRKAIQNTRSPEIFWKVSNKMCVRVPDAGRCYNVQVRELCDGRTIG